MFAAWSGGAIAFACVLIFTPIVIALSRRWKLYDPWGPLKIHQGAISRLGGVSIAIGLAAGITGASFLTSWHVAIWWSVAFGIIGLAGLVDDIRGLSPLVKFSAQVGSGVILGASGWRLPWHFSAPMEILVTCAMVVLLVNAFNFLDGSDGLAAGITAIIAATYVAAAGGASSFGTLVAWALAGAALGFLFFNFPPAKIFMGDSGSTVLGFCVAFLSIDLLEHAQAQPGVYKWFFPFLVAGLPLLDGIAVVLGRLIRGASVFHGDRFHFYDRLLQRGWSPRSVAGVSCAISALFAAAGLWLIGRGIQSVSIFAAVAMVVFLVVGVKGAAADGSLRRGIREHAES
jgi:UDP-GlcNAc:undecaprenyl-phosphate GlcNAc-1-phosphate transferase